MEHYINQQIKQYVVIGAGISGVTACMVLRKSDKESRIYLINGEDYLPYKRTELSKKFSKVTEDAFLLTEKEDYIKQDIELVDARCVQIMESKHAVLLNKTNKDGTSNTYELQYSKLIIAIGKDSFIPPNFDNKLSYFCKSKSEVLRLKNNLPNIKSVCIIGGGILGLEMANSLLEQKIDITIVDSQSTLLSKQVDAEYSDYLATKLDENGIKYLLNSQILNVRFSDQKTMLEIKTQGNDDISYLKFDAVLSCYKYEVPKIPSESIKHDHGYIIVDDYFQCANDVYAIGDCVIYQGKAISSWHESEDSAICVGTNLLLPKERRMPFLKKRAYRTKVDLFGDFYYSLNYMTSKDKKCVKVRSKDVGESTNNAVLGDTSEIIKLNFSKSKMADIYVDESGFVCGLITLNIAKDKDIQRQMGDAILEGINATSLINKYIN